MLAQHLEGSQRIVYDNTDRGRRRLECRLVAYQRPDGARYERFLDEPVPVESVSANCDKQVPGTEDSRIDRDSVYQDGSRTSHDSPVNNPREFAKAEWYSFVRQRVHCSTDGCENRTRARLRSRAVSATSRSLNGRRSSPIN